LRAGVLGFDMPGGAYTHEDGRCSRETLIARTRTPGPALARIAGIVHDIDLRDGRYGHPETAGVERLLGGVIAAHPDDPGRIEAGLTLFDHLFRSLEHPARVSPPPAL